MDTVKDHIIPACRQVAMTGGITFSFEAAIR
jgi:hypothetical protein